MYNDKEMIELFGFPFYFVHGTNVGNLLSLIKKEKIQSSTEVEKDDSVIKGFGGGDYVHCTAVFKNIDMQTKEKSEENINNIIECLEKGEDSMKDCLDKQQENYKKIHIRQFTVYLMPEDPPERRKFKLKLIKYFVEVLWPEKPSLYTNRFEFLFANTINLKKYLTHILILECDQNTNETMEIEKIIKKKKRKYVIKYIDYDDTINKYTFK